MSVDIENGFEPTYEVPDSKKKVVSELRKAVKGVDTVWLASDEDREGEAIAWHLQEALKLKAENTKRITFHEITKTAITEAIKTPRTVDINLVDAQQARRILDRLVGYTLSPVLWKKVRAGLSAGRVQSVAVRIIVEREREISAFETASFFKVTAEFDLGKKIVLRAELPQKLETEKEAEEFLKSLIGADFSVDSLKNKPGKRSPSAPFTTSTIQQEASRKLGFSVKQTMVVAQQLYEAGKITYMRTDSVNISDVALAQAKDYITSEFGANYHEPRKFKTKSASAQEAHEAIRPTDLSEDSAGGDDRQKKLYDLIWKRTLASQMAEAKLEKTVAQIKISTREDHLVAEGEVLTFDGFLKVYGGFEKAEDKILPPLSEGQALPLILATARESFSRPPARYTEASLVKKMEEMGIGRPSTYAPTISTVQDRGYVEKGELEGRERAYKVLTCDGKSVTKEDKTEMTGADKGKLIPTETGNIVTDFLVKNFADVVDYQFTARVEGEFDEVAQGKKAWREMMSSFYTPFAKTIEAADGIDRSEAMGVRELGVHPKNGKPIFVRLGRFGPMFQCGTKDDEEKPAFASLPTGKKMEDVTLEDAMEMFKLPRLVGQTPEGEDIQANVGRFGPYIKFGKLYVSIKPEDPSTITLETALELIAAKKKAEAEKFIQVFEGTDIQVLNGRYGPYITDGKKNAKIPKDKKPEKLTLKECEKLIKDAPAKGKGRRFVKKKAS